MSQPYQSLEAELHDAFQDSHGPSPELPLMEALLTRHPGRSLEIGCGSGRLLLPLLEAGFEVEGLELSADMLALARNKAASLGLNARLHQGDMSTWAPQNPYANLLVPSFTLQLAGDPAATLRHWRNWLLPGGALYLTTFMPYGELTGELPEGEWYFDHDAFLADGGHATLETRHELQGDDLKLVRHHRYRIKNRPGAVYESSQTIRWAEPWQWRQWLEEAGFEVDAQFLDWDPGLVVPRPGPEDFDGIITTLGAAKPKPGAAKPKPGAAKPKPGAAKPKPGAAKPKPGAAKPKPGAAKPKPGAAKPKPGLATDS